MRRLFVVFAAMGAATASIPAGLPMVAATAGESVEGYLAAVPALFFGLLAGVILSSMLGSRVSSAVMIRIGALIQAVAFAAMAGLSTQPLSFVLAAASAGIGFGLTEAGATIRAREAAAAGTPQLLSALTGTVAAVAALTPLLFLTPLRGMPWLIYAGIAVVHIILACTTVGNGIKGSFASTNTAGGAASALLPAAIALFLYVGVETVFAGWSSILPMDLVDVDPEWAALGTSAFWILLSAGRYAATGLIGAGITAVACLRGFGVIAATAFATAALASALPVLVVAALCVGVMALGPCYALIIGIGLARVDAYAARKATGLLVACGSGGGAAIPALLLLTSGGTGASVFATAAGLILVAAGTATVVLSRGAAADAHAR
ncbi:MFS transporter [Microbacterium halotolerans]|uniref:MFS transporter n=1 Tax=Microbacterium halotolerans TaxID=246613 RepID=UPI000E6ADA50|nr:hypothetical protein [Microbacterium halotolerans]